MQQKAADIILPFLLLCSMALAYYAISVATTTARYSWQDGRPQLCKAEVTHSLVDSSPGSFSSYLNIFIAYLKTWSPTSFSQLFILRLSLFSFYGALLLEMLGLKKGTVHSLRIFGIVFTGFCITAALAFYFFSGNQTKIPYVTVNDCMTKEEWFSAWNSSFPTCLISLLSYVMSFIWFGTFQNKELGAQSWHRWLASTCAIVMMFAIGHAAYIQVEASYLDIIYGYVFGWFMGFFFMAGMMNTILYPRCFGVLPRPGWLHYV